MAGVSEDELRRGTEAPSVSGPRLGDRASEHADVRQVSKDAAIAVDLRDGFRNERRSPEYRAIHGLPPDGDDTHEDWIARLHQDDRHRTVKHFLDDVKGTAEQT